MNNKGKTNNIVIIAVVAAVVVLGLFLVFGGKSLIPSAKGDIVNGYWDEPTQQCRSAPDRPSGVPYIPGEIGVTLYQCCFNALKQQVDCNSPDLLWGAGSFAIYQGQEGLFFLTHGITITNTGNVDLTNAWIDSASWTPINTDLTNAYTTVVGSGFGSPLAQSLALDFSTGQIDLQAIGGPAGSPATYDLSLVTKASAVGLPEASTNTPASITVEAEGIGFSVDIDLGGA